MQISKLLLLFGVLLLTGESLAAQCKNPPQRKEWQLTQSRLRTFTGCRLGSLRFMASVFYRTYERYLRGVCGYKGAQPYWNWALDASATDNSLMAIFETEIFDSEYGFGGNGKPFLSATAAENPFDLTGRTGGGCVQDGPFRKGKFFINPNIHGSHPFGVGGVLGTLGNSAHRPGDPLFFLHHCNIDRVLWNWQQKDLPRRLHEVGGPIEPLDYSGQNVTLDFEINIGKLAGNATLEQLLNTKGDVLCYDYYTPELAAPQDGGNTGGWHSGRYARRG
ncbi:uncharacterized protein N7458_011471 [Penicillium daleae]|uniref:Tyrosinase copper-binding domain-containing protein n=1 Tax=Penicillium daleae TaxID=63821 RepID=A0AAD6FXH5_9EURO|nr:uncharacterized protein N7458_011471 [Penicillium daleae]KAJ5432315.1 hypothetical protein N7458_011471 [Penicillium daleae]